MFTRLTQVKNYILAHKVISAIIIIAALGFGGSMLRPAAPPNLSTATVERKTLVQSVEETGSLETGLEVSYGFETSGRVISVKKKAGDTVILNDVLAELDGRDERAALSAAQASYAGALADLNQQLAGGSDEDRRSATAKVAEARAYLSQAEADRDQAALDAQNALDAAQTAVDKAKNNLQLAASGSDSAVVKDAYDDLYNTLYGVLSDMDEAAVEVDAVLGYDNVYANDTFETIGSVSVSLMQDANSSYKVAKEYNRLFKSALDTASVSQKQSDMDVAATRAQTLVSQMRIVVRNVFAVLNDMEPDESSLQPTLDAIVVSIQTTQSAVNTTATTLTSAVQAVTSAKNSVSTYQIVYDQAVRDLATATKQKETTIKNAQSVVDLRRAGLEAAQAAYDKVVNPPREIDLASLRAELSRRGAEVSARAETFNKTKLIARTGGVIGKLDVKVGESTIANSEVVTILSEDYLVKVDIAESDITKVSLGDPVTLTFDATNDREFTGRVIEIDASKTEISGVVYYKTTIAVDAMEGTDQLRSGMTVDVTIETEKKESVLVVPRRAIVARDGKKYVRVVTDKKKGTYEEREVETGLSGDDGLTEVVNGLEEGVEIVTFIEEAK
jgi:RND family efflux transporter MFP subunit